MIDRPLVLVVDDEPQIQRFLRHSLMAAGYEVEQAETGQDAMRLVEAHDPAVIVLDLGLPDIDGKLVIGAVRERCETPIIVLSARERETEKVAALDLGANEYVEKPASASVCGRAEPAKPRSSRLFLANSQSTCEPGA
jgi:two-component system KDP operon response regulator KdpE